MQLFFYFFFQAEDGIRDLVRSRGLGDVYKRQHQARASTVANTGRRLNVRGHRACAAEPANHGAHGCLLYQSDAADDLLCVDLGGCRIIKKKQNNKKKKHNNYNRTDTSLDM